MRINVDKTEDAFKAYHEKTDMPPEGKLSGHLVFQIIKEKDQVYFKTQTVSSFKLLLLKVLNFIGFGSETRLREILEFVKTNKGKLDRFPSYEAVAKKLNQKVETHNKNSWFNKIPLLTQKQMSFGSGTEEEPGFQPQQNPTPAPSPAPTPNPFTPKPTPVPTSNPRPAQTPRDSVPTPPNPQPIPNVNPAPQDTPAPTPTPMPTPIPDMPPQPVNSSAPVTPTLSQPTPQFSLTINGVSNPSRDQQIKSEPKGVGILGAQWTFESDHIPVGGRIKTGQMTVNFASFNVCNTQYLHYILGRANAQGVYPNPQGLMESDIIKKNRPLQVIDPVTQEVFNVTEREFNIVNTHIRNMGLPQSGGGGGNDCIFLPECGQNMLKYLEASLPPQFGIHIVKRGNLDTQAYLYNKEKFNIEIEASQNFSNIDANKVISSIILSSKPENGPIEKLRIVGTHLPGGPHIGNSKADLAKFVAGKSDGITTLVMGDMNTTTKDLSDSLNTDATKPFYAVTRGTKSHVDTHRHAIDYDSVFVSPGKADVEVSERAPKEILPELDNIVKRNPTHRDFANFFT